MTEEKKEPFSRANEYVIIRGDANEFIRRCKEPRSSNLKLLSFEDQIVKMTNGECKTLEEFIRYSGEMAFFLLGSYKNDKEFMDTVDKTDHRNFLITADDIDEASSTDVFIHLYLIGGVFKIVRLKDYMAYHVLEAKTFGFPERYTPATAPVLLKSGKVVEKSTGIFAELNFDPFNIFKVVNDDKIQHCKYLNWYNTTFYNQVRDASISDRFSIFKRVAPKPSKKPTLSIVKET